MKNPDERPSFDEILMDDFFNQGSAIPKLLPLASLVFPPTLDYIKKFIPNIDKNGISQLHLEEKLEEEMKLLKEEEIKENKEEKNDNINNKEKTEENSTKEGSNINDKKIKENSININDKIGNNKNKEKIRGVDVYIIKWVDYSSKYGIGYLFNNHSIGVYFNDCTKLIYNPKTNKVSFIERKLTKEKDMMYIFGLNEIPKELEKKILIFQEFKKYFEEEINKKNNKGSPNKMNKKYKIMSGKTIRDKKEKKEEKKEEKEPEKEVETVFLRKWMRTNQAIIFRLSNKTIQVILKDHSEIILFDDIVNYKNKNKICKTYKLEDAINSSNFEMNKRIKYVQSIFTKIISYNSQKK